MNYDEINDNELLFLVSESNEEARSELVKKYTGIVHKIAYKYISLAETFGIEEKDLVQEGLIGLSKAIDTYDTDKNVLFYTYVTLCIESSIKSALRNASKKKHQSLNSSISLDKLYEEEMNINEILKDETSDPSIQLLDKESIDEMLLDSKKVLAPFEYEVFKLKAEGYSNEEIAIKTNKDKKSIENTMFRIKNKLKDKIKNK